ncbi:hypothetical protein LXL04_002586 [Taraxacum kok-saghyz]
MTLEFILHLYFTVNKTKHQATSLEFSSGNCNPRITTSSISDRWRSGQAITRRIMSSSSAVHGSRSMSSWWKNVEPAPKDPILGAAGAFLTDPSPDKVNVGFGDYRDDNRKPVVLDHILGRGSTISSDFSH